MNKSHTYLLFLILVIAFIIRLPQINFPSIGYHNMKENEFISMAKNMLKTKNIFSRYVDFHYGLEEERRKIDLFPGGYLTAYQILLCLKVFGEDNFLGYARFINIVFIVISILFLYKVSFLLSGSREISILSSIILTILPLSIFFSRNLQPESPAFLFMVLGTYYYLLYIKKLNLKYLIYLGISSVFIFLYKLTFLIGFIPLFFIFPYKKAFQSNYKIIKQLFLSFLPLLILISIFIMSGELKFGASKGRIDLFIIFTYDYWRRYGWMIYNYIVRENYTIFYTLSCFIGIVLIIFREKNLLLKKYIIGWLMAIILYSMVLQDYINQHNYYQMPFLLLVAFCSAYFLMKLASFCNNLFKKKIGNWLVAGFIVVSLFSVFSSVRAAYRTVFFGEDIAGRFLRSHLDKHERFFLYTWAQGYGICVYADRRCGWPKNLREFVEKENKFKIRYIAVYPFSFFERIDPQIKDYIINNYRIVHVGFLYNSSIKKMVPYTLILEKGGRVDFGSFYRNHKNNLFRKIYRVFNERFYFFVMEEYGRR